MKTKTKIAIACGCACAATLLLAGCTIWDTPYDTLGKSDYTVSVRYDINGGQFEGSPDTDVVDVFHIDTAKKGVKLLDPASEDRINNRGNPARLLPTRSGYSLAGWYAVREPRVDGNGNALDEYGELCSVSGRPQGMEYGDRWDFGTREFKYDTPSKDEVALTLYAGWVPNFIYRFLTPDATAEGGFAEAGTYTFNPTLQSPELALPYWADERTDLSGEELEDYLQNTFTGAMTYGSFPRSEGKTFEAIYSDRAMKQQITTDTIIHAGEIDVVTGTAKNIVQTYYTTWLNGTYFHIYSAKQLASNTSNTGSYDIRRDLDFSLKDDNGFFIARWGNGFANGDYSGNFSGHGHKISNITVTQADTSQLRGGLFGRLMAGSSVTDVTFENITYELNAATRYAGGEFGLFAGSIAAGATVSDVTIVNGVLKIGNGIYTGYARYAVGLVASNYSGTGVTHDIKVELVPRESGDGKKIWSHQVSVGANGHLTISRNENESVEPEIKYEDQGNGGN